MIDIKFEITEEDIKKYLKENEVHYEYCESLFIKYLKDNKGKLPKEIVDILINEITKLNNNDELSCFDLKTVNNLDLSGICHILIPAKRYYNFDKMFISIKSLNEPLKIIAEKLEIPFENKLEVINDAVNNYRICGKLDILYDEFIRFKMSREHAKNELLMYQKYYDKDKVKLIKKIVKEGVR